MNLSPQGGLVDLLDPPRITMPMELKNGAPRARQIARQADAPKAPLSLEAELAQTRALRLRCERLLGELGCPVEVDVDLQRGAA